MFKHIILILLSSILTLAAEFKNGDIIFTKTEGKQAIAVEAATNSPWTHTAVIFIERGTPMVLEAVQPIQIISLSAYLARSVEKSSHSFKRLIDPKPLDKDALLRARKWAKKHLGKNYDGRFQWTEETLYCSELVWKIFYQCAGIKLCPVKQVKNYNLKHPKVKQLIIERFGNLNRLNLEEKIVAPSDIFESPFLVEFYPLKKKVNKKTEALLK